MFLSLGMNTKARFFTSDLHIHYICFLISVRYRILFIVYYYKTVKTGLPRCDGGVVFEGEGKAELGKYPVYKQLL